MALKIIEARIVGLCSKHREKDDDIPRYKDGREIPEEELACLGCIFIGQDKEKKK